MASTARDFALVRLDSIQLPGWESHALQRGHGNMKRTAAEPQDGRDRALAERIVVGTVKNLLLLQYLISFYSGRSPKSIDGLVQKILAIGLYQLRFLDRVPASAAVDEAVDQTRRFGRTKASGFVNAILRRATREPNVPLPDRSDAEQYAMKVLSHPPELCGRLIELLGVEDALRFCEHDNSEPPTIVRLFAGRSSDDLITDGITVAPHEQAGMFVIEPAKVPLLADWAERGIAQVQDPTAALVADFCDIRPGQTVLDRCAGLGTKTLQLREKLGETGSITAMDASTARCETLRNLARRRSIQNVTIIHGNYLAETQPARFDRVLVDAPCSNSGVLARRPEARYSQDSNSLKSLERLQAEILGDSAGSVRPGGLLIYSTCSVWPSENQQTVDAFLKRHSAFDLADTRTTVPSLIDDPTRYRDGGFVAVMRRKG